MGASFPPFFTTFLSSNAFDLPNSKSCAHKQAHSPLRSSHLAAGCHFDTVYLHRFQKEVASHGNTFSS